MELRRKLDQMAVLRLGASASLSKLGNDAYNKEVDRLRGLLSG
jgi:hypothetical protein